MFPAKQLLTVFFVSEILFGKNPVDGSRDSCPESAVVDLTEETSDSSGAINKSGILFLRQMIRYDDLGRFGCMCDIRICRPLCCSSGDAASSNGCVKDEYTSIVSEILGSWVAGEFHEFVRDPCQLGFMKNTSMKKYNWARDQPYDITFRKHCLLRRVGSMEYIYGICLDKNILSGLIFSESITPLQFTCNAVRAFFMLATLIVYSVTPKLKNLQGLLLRCYIGSELGSLTLFHVCRILVNESSTLLNRVLLWVTGIALYTFDSATTFWLTVINFDVWWKFRRFRSNRHTNPKEYEKAMFLRYSTCTLSGSIIATSITFGCLIWLEVADPLTKVTFRPIFLMTICSVALPCIICVSASIYMFTSTALTIRRQKNEIAYAVDDADRHRKYNINKKRFKLYLGLLTLMGCYKVFRIATFFWNNLMYRNFYRSLGAVHGLFTFLIFVWRDDIKRSFRSQVIKILQKWGVCLHPNPKPVAENENETP